MEIENEMMQGEMIEELAVAPEEVVSENVETVEPSEFDYLDNETGSVEEAPLEEPVEESKPHHKRKGHYAAISNAQRERDEAIQRAAYLERELQARQQPGMQAPQAPAPVQDDAVVVENFIRGVLKNELKTEMAREQEERAQIAQHHEFQTELNKASHKYEDFDDVVLANPSIMQDEEIMGMAKLVSNGMELLRHLGRNPEKLHSIKYLPRAAKAKALIQIDQEIALRLHAKKTTNAPAPLKKTGGGGTPPQAKMDKFDSNKAYLKSLGLLT